MSMTAEYRRGHYHVHRFISGEHLLIATRNELSSPLFCLSLTGVVLWEGLADWTSTDSLVQELLSRFEVDPEAAAADVQHFLEHLRSLSALQIRETPA